MWLEQKEPGPACTAGKKTLGLKASTLSLQAVRSRNPTMQRLAAGAAAATGRAAAGAGSLGTCRGLAYRPSVSPSAPGRQGLMGFGGMVSALG